MAISATNLDKLLKELYAGQAVSKLVFDEKARPLTKMLTKRSDFSGSKFPLPVIYDDMAGRSASFTVAQTNNNAMPNTRFEIDIVKNYCLADIETEALLRCRNEKGAFINALTGPIDAAINTLSNDIERSLFLDGSGSLGVVSSIAGDLVVTLTNAGDALNFVVGGKYVAADTTASALRSATASTVSSVDYSAGTVTFSAAISGKMAAQAGDYLFQEGDYAAASARNKVKGLAAWLPTTAPTGGDSFFGVDRSVNTDRLAGVRYSGSSGAIEESIISGASKLCGVSPQAVPDKGLCSFATFRKAVLEMGSQVQRNPGGSAASGFSSLSVYGPKGEIVLVPSAFCPDDKIYLLQANTWMIASMNELVHIISHDGLRIRARDTADAFEVRVGSWAQLACKAPGCNAVITL